jgi:hypothetical protein
MDITIPNLKPGKHRVLLKYSDPFSNTDSSFSRALFIETPKAPPLISLSANKPTVSKQKVMKNVTKTYTDTVSHRQRTSNVVTLWTTSAHGLKKGNKISLSGMAIDSLNGSYTITSIPNAKMVKIIKKGTNFAKISDGGTISLSQTTSVLDYYKATITIPVNLKNNLEWTTTLRDVVFFLYEVDGGVLKYVDSDISTGGTNFTTTVPTYPAGLNKKRVNGATQIGSGSYTFRYVIVRYYKNSSGTWVGYFPMLKKDSVSVSSIDDIIVSAAGAL